MSTYHNKNGKFEEHEIEIISDDEDSEWEEDEDVDENDEKHEFRDNMIKEKKKR